LHKTAERAAKYAIATESLTRKFDDLVAVDNITLSVPTGELFGLLGPNGAGKTTTINMLSTLLNATSGYAEVTGFDVSKKRDEVRRSIGVVFQEMALDSQLTGKENLTFHAMMYGMGKTDRQNKIGEVLELVELTDKADVLVRNYSGGMKRRLEIARGLIHRPQVLFLDEPTLGLDAQTRRHIWDYIKKLNTESDVTIILTTHYMDEADFLCERVAIMDQGKFVAIDSPDKLQDILGGEVVTLELEGDPGGLEEKLAALDWIKTKKRHEKVLNLTMEKSERRIPELINLAQEAGVTVTCVNLRKPSLEDVYLYFTGKTMRKEEASQGERNRFMMRGHFGRRR